MDKRMSYLDKKMAKLTSKQRKRVEEIARIIALRGAKSAWVSMVDGKINGVFNSRECARECANYYKIEHSTVTTVRKVLIVPC